MSVCVQQSGFVAVCCSVLQCVAVCCSVLQCVALCYSVLQGGVPKHTLLANMCWCERLGFVPCVNMYTLGRFIMFVCAMTSSGCVWVWLQGEGYPKKVCAGESWAWSNTVCSGVVRCFFNRDFL